MLECCGLGTEQVVDIVYRPQAVFKVRAVTRCAASLPGIAFSGQIYYLSRRMATEPVPLIFRRTPQFCLRLSAWQKVGTQQPHKDMCIMDALRSR